MAAWSLLWVSPSRLLSPSFIWVRLGLRPSALIFFCISFSCLIVSNFLSPCLPLIRSLYFHLCLILFLPLLSKHRFLKVKNMTRINQKWVHINDLFTLWGNEQNGETDSKKIQRESTYIRHWENAGGKTARSDTKLINVPHAIKPVTYGFLLLTGQKSMSYYVTSESGPSSPLNSKSGKNKNMSPREEDDPWLDLLGHAPAWHQRPSGHCFVLLLRFG